ncbi:hypothetical protein NX059_002930 [Plenodomus lindquistii]|nr:hypothetical protein NX059_002930 [Plenodomus lindquistii]
MDHLLSDLVTPVEADDGMQPSAPLPFTNLSAYWSYIGLQPLNGRNHAMWQQFSDGMLAPVYDELLFSQQVSQHQARRPFQA